MWKELDSWEEAAQWKGTGTHSTKSLTVKKKQQKMFYNYDFYTEH